MRLTVVSLFFATSAYAQVVPPTTFIDLEYSYDPTGNVTSIIDHNDPQNNRSMQYDNLDRLTGATGPWGPGSFIYDPIGNRTNKTIGSTSKNYSYGPSDNRLSGYSHDPNGNLLQDDNFTYVYDSQNRLVRVLSGANTIVEYKYDGDGRRISKTANGETTYYAYGTGLNVLTEFNGQGVPKYDYIYAGNKNVARVNFDANGAPESKTFYHTDHLGSTLAITDAFTTVVWDQNYLPFGESYLGSGTVANSHQYTGKEYESETGLYYYGARYYHPNLGRFMSVDPAGIDVTNPQSLNRYAYVQNNPFGFTDPDGQYLETAFDVFNISLGVISLKRNLTEGNYFDAAIDAGGVLLDSAAAATPFVPGGAATVIRAGRTEKGISQVINEELTQLTKKGIKKPVVIGESMKRRIIPTAKKLDAEYYKPRNTKGDLLKKNVKYIDDKIREEREIIDIGIDPGRSKRSPFYEVEKQRIEKRKYPVTNLNIDD